MSAREEGRVAGRGGEGGGAEGGGPVEAGENAGERPGLAGDGVGEDGEGEGGEARRIAVGAEREVVDLRSEAVDDVGEHRAAGEGEQRLVAAAHAAWSGHRRG